MTPTERKNLADQIATNPIYNVLMDEIEQSAVERMISAQTDTARLEAQAYVRATRAFREDCDAMLRNYQERKGAPV